MIYQASWIAIILFLSFVGFVLGLSFYFARKAKSADGYFAAGGTVNWFVNGIAFAGDYLSAASFLGICGMIAFYGYDGFLYSIGFLAGWVVALFVVAEPMKRLGKYTFADALDAKFNSKGIQLMAAIGTLVVSMFYLIPQMVGAGVLVKPLLGLEHWMGVCIVGVIVVFIVATAGMTSTTYVQFLKGGMLIVFSSIICIYLFKNGFTLNPDNDGKPYHHFETLELAKLTELGYERTGEEKVSATDYSDELTFIKLTKDQEITIDKKTETKPISTWWKLLPDGKIEETLSSTILEDKTVLYNGAVKEAKLFYQRGCIEKLPKDVKENTAQNPIAYIATITGSEINRYPKVSFEEGSNKIMVWHRVPTSGAKLLAPGMYFMKADKNGHVSGWSKLNFISLMLALFFGTASLPHILIRYYTVPSQKDARKSTIVAIGSIGFFYILTLFMGVGAMVSGVLDVTDGNMSAPLLAKGMGIILFSIISAVAFATVLGTVSGLIVAASGAVAHDLMDNYIGIKFSDKGKVFAGKMAAIVVGLIAIVLGIVFEGVNVGFLVGWAFAVAASANLPAIIMLLFWKKTTAKGITASIFVGMVSAVTILAISPKMMGLYEQWNWGTFTAPFKLGQPGIISIPLAFLTLVVVSLMTQKDNDNLVTEEAEA